jgi:hypothetical protein
MNELHALPQLIWQFSVNNVTATDAANFPTLFRYKFCKAEDAKQMIWQPFPCSGAKRALCMYLPELINMLVGA